MTKAELIQENEELKEEVYQLQDELDSLNEAYCELERINADLTSSVDNYYFTDVNNFISRLKAEDLYTPEFERFMEDYIRWHN